MGLRNAQYHAIMREYEKRQLKSHDIQTARYEEVYTKLPEFKSLDDSISILSVQHGKKLLNGDPTALSSLKEELALLRASKKKLLTSAGYPENYLEPVYECPDCKDTGYVNGRRCHCFEQAAINLVYTQSNLKEILELLLRKNPNIRVVLNTVTVETLAEAASCFKKLAFEEPEIVCLQASNAKKAGRSHLMIAQNPVYIFTAQGGAKE